MKIKKNKNMKKIVIKRRFEGIKHKKDFRATVAKIMNAFPQRSTN
jgi:hypothetical protein